MAEPRPRRGHGEDSIYFDQANNHWVGAVSLGYKAGKRVRKTVTGRTKTAVKTKLRQLRQELDNGVRSSATYTVGNALDDWLAGGLSGRSDRTRELYRDTVKPLREPLGDIKLRELTAGDVQQTLDALADRLSTRTLQILRNCLERAIRHAEVRDLVGRNVAAVVKPPRRNSGPPVQEPDPGAGAGAAAGRPGFPSVRLRGPVGDDRPSDRGASGASVERG